ncbi:signal peptidase I [Alphaproteobacteria bacterium]|jgi:signal peptidase I|nr:signal peptidase I [Alphaproteobacteria bacterium]
MSDNRKQSKDSLSETFKTILWAGVLVLIIRSFIFQPYNIPSGSMKPTLLIGDYLIVTKFSYGFSQHSMPFSPPLWSGRVLASQPERGDVIVFKLPRDNSTDYIKRLIGLPGDRIMVRSGILYINGTAVKRELIAPFIDHDKAGRERSINQYRETLPNGVTYLVLDEDEQSIADNTIEFLVPEGHYFMMGDNRDNSTDSRFLSFVGYVPYENLVGPAQFLFYSFDDRTKWWQVWEWPFAIRYSRLFNMINSSDE